MNLRRHTLALAITLGLAALFAFAACGDDNGDDGDAARESAADLQANLENFQRDITGIGNIEETPDNLKDGLKDSCSDLQDEIDSDKLDDFCGDLGDAIDDENQTDYETLKARVGPDVIDEFRDEIADRLNDAAETDGDNNDDEE